MHMREIHLRESKHREGETVQEHHHQTYQILYVLEDEGKITLDGKEYNFKQDNVAFITPYSDHSIIANSKLTILVLEFSIVNLDIGIQTEIIYKCFDDSDLLVLNLFAAGEIRQLLRKMLYEQSVGGSINQLALKIYLSELLLILMKAQEEPKVMDANILRAERLRKYIDTHYYEMINASYISTMLGMSIRHINNIFKEHYDITPIQYLTEVRMELSKKLLLETDKDIVSICFEVGFESLSTFYRSFKKYTNTSPNQFRAQYQEPYLTE
jgi:AraC-like DNA-binding protein